ncbi:MAG: tetratricopeptide repeat protein [Proteobacteria bacterium]|nr:tetratricopeptide repeat protein [Pseudomonadota bacterium]
MSDSAALAADLDEGLAHHRAGRLEEADAAYRRVLAARSDHPDALHLLGVMAHHAGDDESALELIGRAIKANPSNAVYHNNIGEVYRTTGRLDEAVAAYRRVLELKPDHADGYNSLGAALRMQGKVAEALTAYRRAVALKPDHADAHYNIGIVLQEQGRLDEAIAAYRRAVAVKPDWAKAQYNMGVALRVQGRPEEAVAAYHRVLELEPDHLVVHENLGEALYAQGKLEEAIATCRRALDIDPGRPGALVNLGIALQEQGRLDEAIAAYRRASDDFPGANSNLLMCLHYRPEYDASAIFAEHRHWAARHAGALGATERPHQNTPDPDRRLSIGYISPDFRSHSVAHWFEEILGAHDAARVRAVCYADVPRPDNTTARLRSLAGAWRETLGMTDADVADQVRRDGIDIFVDLAGHTANNRLLVFARKPAPVQVTYLGYFNTTGLAAIDYIIADRFVIPPAEERYYVEKVVRLPGCYVCFTPPDLTIEPGPLPALGRDGVTFGSFNNRSKITPDVVSLWAEILRAVPGSRLILKTKALRDAAVCQRLVEEFRDQGVPPDRLVLEGPSPWHDLLRMYDRMDIALDPFPYAGGTTTAEALWMGVPVMTLKGDRFASRVSESILMTADLPDLVARSRRAYLEKAVALAADLPRLADLRAGLRRRFVASVCDAPSFTRGLEAAYREMWRNWCEGEEANA